MPRPIIAIVGCPNVGKSMLFNRIVGERRAIVHDMPGVTRDRLYAEANWNGVDFLLVDTGGIEPNTDSDMLKKMREQAEVAIETADSIAFVVDGQGGLTANDHDVAIMLLKSRKPITLIVNKIDNPGQPPSNFYEFYNLGLGDPFACSSMHGLGIGDALDNLLSTIQTRPTEEVVPNQIKVAIIGKPNVGKSSIINAIMGEERVIVSNVAGTTRDTIDTFIEHEGTSYVFVDTAGLRRRSKVTDTLEHFTVVRALSAVEHADVALIVLDAENPISEQDTKIAGFAHEQGKASIFVVNKWDMITKDNKTTKTFENEIKTRFAFMDYAPIMFVSAKTGQRVFNIFERVAHAYAQNNMRISTGLLNDVLNDAMLRHQPPSDKGRRLKIYYMTQVSTRPPTFILFVNKKDLAHFSYIRYVENQVRQTFGLDSTPLHFIIREKNSDKEGVGVR